MAAVFQLDPPSKAAVLPGELLTQILAWFSHLAWPDRRPLWASSLVCRHWHAHGANLALYANVVILTRRASRLLDRTLSYDPSFGGMIVSLRMIPFGIHPVYDYASSTVNATPSGSYFADDKATARVVLNIIRAAYNLRTLAVTAGEDRHQQFAFKDLMNNIVSQRLTTLCLSGGNWPVISIESLVVLLQSPPCARLEELHLWQYSISRSDVGPEWWRAVTGLPPVSRLWIRQCRWITYYPHGPVFTSPHGPAVSAIPALFRRTLQSVHTTDVAGSWPTTCQTWSSHDWPRLTSFGLAGPVNVDPSATATLDVSTFPHLQRLALPAAVFMRAYSLLVSFPERIDTLVLLVPCDLSALNFFGSFFASWLRRHGGPSLAARVRELCIKVECRRVWSSVQMWKVLILALAMHETSIAITGDFLIWESELDLPDGELEDEPIQTPAAQSSLRQLWAKVLRR